MLGEVMTGSFLEVKHPAFFFRPAKGLNLHSSPNVQDSLNQHREGKKNGTKV